MECVCYSCAAIIKENHHVLMKPSELVSVLAGDSSPQSEYLDRSVLFHRIKDLNPQTTYIVSIGAIYGNAEGPDISLSQLTGTEGRRVALYFDLTPNSSLSLSSVYLSATYRLDIVTEQMDSAALRLTDCVRPSSQFNHRSL